MSHCCPPAHATNWNWSIILTLFESKSSQLELSGFFSAHFAWVPCNKSWQIDHFTSQNVATSDRWKDGLNMKKCEGKCNNVFPLCRKQNPSTHQFSYVAFFPAPHISMKTEVRWWNWNFVPKFGIDSRIITKFMASHSNRPRDIKNHKNLWS
jgi:hypothetical protein